MSHSGVYDTAEVYLYDGQKIVETRDGSGNATKQFIHGIQYIDELLMVRVMNKGEFYVHQDANWNVVALTNLRGGAGGAVVERYVYTPYGEVNVMQATSFGDRDGDEDVDSTDKGTVGTTCNTTPVTGECRILDLDFDGDYDATDAGFFDYLPQGVGRHPGKFASGVDQPFHHQGLLFEPETRQYQNRARQYDPGKKRFAQRDPLGRMVRARGVYRDGLHLAEYLGSAPYSYVDPMGTKFSLGGFLNFLGAVITQLPIFLGETAIGIVTGHNLDGGMDYGNYCGPHQRCFGYNHDAHDDCVVSGGRDPCPSDNPGCTRPQCPQIGGGSSALDECCRRHDGCYCNSRPENSDHGLDVSAGCLPDVDSPEGLPYPPVCHDYFTPTDRTRACDGLLCDCMDRLTLPFGSTAWNQREQMRIVFGCFAHQ